MPHMRSTILCLFGMLVGLAVAQDCPDLAGELEAMHTTSCALTRTGDTCQVQCSPSYTGTGTSLTCDGNLQQWIGSLPSCTPNDQVDPVFTDCPGDIFETVGADENTVEVEYFLRAEDDVDGVLLSNTISDTFPIGQTPISTTITDAAGNSAVCSFSVVVIDATTPEVLCPPTLDFTLNGPIHNIFEFGCKYSVNGEIVDETIPNDDLGSCFINITENDSIVRSYISIDLLETTEKPAGEYDAAFVAIDASGNMGQCPSTITVHPYVPPPLDEDSIEYKLNQVQNIDLDSLADPAAVNAALEDLSALTASLDADDVEGIALVASVLGTIVGQTSLNVENRQSVSSTALNVAQLQAQRLEAAKQLAASEVCGNGVCLAAAEHCDTCPEDCGPCELTVASQPAAIIAQYQAGATGFGTSNFTVDATFAPGLNYTVEHLTRRQALDADIDVSAGIPAGHSFMGIFFSLADVANDEHVLTIDTTYLSRTLPAGAAFFVVNWGDSAVAACPNQEGRLDRVADKLYSGTFCGGDGLYALAVNTTLSSVEENLVKSVAASLVTDANSTDASSAADINNKVFETVQAVTGLMSAGLKVGDPAVTIEADGVSIQAEQFDKNSLSNVTTSVGDTGVTIPAGFGSQLSSAASDVTLAYTLFESNPFAWNDSDISNTAVIDFSIRDANGEVEVGNLPEESRIELIFPIDNSSIPQDWRECRYWDENATVANCPYSASDPACRGAWVTTGVTRKDSPNNPDQVICVVEHLSSFSFKIRKPEISLDNFSAQSKWIYVVMACFFGVALLTGLFSFAERKAYDRRQLKIVRGEIEDDEVVEVEMLTKPAPTTGWRSWYIPRMFYNFFHNMKTRHHVLALFWPTGRKVYPKRFTKVLALIASTSLAFGLESMFAYTNAVVTAEGEQRTSNTWHLKTIWGDHYLPMDGFYVFFIALPALIVLSIFLGKYSAYSDIVRKMAPRRFRALTAQLRQEMIQRGLPLEAYFGKGRKRMKKMARKAYLESKKEAKRAAKQNKKDGFAAIDEDLGEFHDAVADEVKMAWQEKVGAQSSSAVVWNPETLKETAVDDEAVSITNSLMEDDGISPSPNEPSIFSGDDRPLLPGASGAHDDAQAFRRRDSLFGEEEAIGAPKVTSKDDGYDAISCQNSMDIVLTKEAMERRDSLDDDDEDLFDQQLREMEEIMELEFNETTEELVDKMIRWKRRAITLCCIYFIGGFLMCFFWVGSLGEDQQRQWIEAFFLYEGLTLLITAPLFIFIFSAIESRLQKKKLEQEQKRKEEERQKNIVGYRDDGTPIYRKKTSKDARKDALREVTATLQKEIEKQLLSFDFF